MPKIRTTKNGRSERVSVNLPPHQRADLEQVCELLGTDMSSFIRKATYEATQKVLDKHNLRSIFYKNRNEVNNLNEEVVINVN